MNIFSSLNKKLFFIYILLISSVFSDDVSINMGNNSSSFLVITNTTQVTFEKYNHINSPRKENYLTENNNLTHNYEIEMLCSDC